MEPKYGAFRAVEYIKVWEGLQGEKEKAQIEFEQKFDLAKIELKRECKEKSSNFVDF